MSIAENKALVERLYAEMDRRQGAPTELYDEAFTMRMNGGPAMNLEAAKQLASGYYAAFPDLVHTVTSSVGEGDQVAVKLTARGTHQGDLMGMPPTDKPIDLTVLALYRVVGGKVIEQTIVLDQVTMLQQLGAMPTPV